MLLELLEKIVNGYFAVVPRSKPAVALIKSTRLIAHRGAHNHAQGIMENTLAAFDQAKEIGCWGIEFDVRVTSDKVLVLHHDSHLKRLWGHDREIADLSFKELRALVPEVPALTEVVAAYGRSLHLFIELKEPFQDEEVLVRTLQELSAGEHYHLLTLTAPIFQTLSQVPRHALLLVASHNNVREFFNLSLKENYGGVLGHYVLINNEVVKTLKATKQIVGVGMVDSKYGLYRELKRGINWIFTDRAAEIHAYLQHF